MKSFVDTTSIIRADKNNCYSKFTPGDSFLSAKTDVANYCAGHYLLHFIRKIKKHPSEL